jgi:Caspase domain
VDSSEAIRLDPKNAQAYDNRGFAYHGRGEYDRALVDYDNALRLQTRNSTFLEHRAATYAAKGEHVRALADYEAALAISPQYAKALAGRDKARASAALSAPASVRLPARPEARQVGLPMPRLNAVLVGISLYRQEPLRLHWAAKNADDLEMTLQRQQGGLYREVNIKVLTDAQANRTAILNALYWLERETTQRDTAVLFLAGHGMTEDKDFFFLPVEADQDRAEVTGLSSEALKRRLGRIPGRVLVILDTCYAGALAGSRPRNLPPDMDKLQSELSAAETGAVVYSATTGRQRAAEIDELRNGVFTKALLGGLRGEADRYPADGVIRMNELGVFLAEEVKRLTDGKQASTFVSLDPIRDVPLFMVSR